MGFPSFFGLFLSFCGVQSKRTSQDTKRYRTNFAGVSAQEEPPVPRNPPTNFIESSVPHKHTNKQTKNLTCKRNSRLVFFFRLYSRQQECKLRGLFVSHICNKKKKTPCSTLYSNNNNSQQKPMSNFVF